MNEKISLAFHLVIMCKPDDARRYSISEVRPAGSSRSVESSAFWFNVPSYVVVDAFRQSDTITRMGQSDKGYVELGMTDKSLEIACMHRPF